MMKILTAASLAVGLAALALPAHAAGSTASVDKAFKSTAAAQYMQLARNENPGGGMYKKSKKKKGKKASSETTTSSMQMARNENPGGGMYKKSKKKKKSA